MSLLKDIWSDKFLGMECYRLECSFKSTFHELDLVKELKDRGILAAAFDLGSFEKNNARAVGLIVSAPRTFTFQWMKYFKRWHHYNVTLKHDGHREDLFP